MAQPKAEAKEAKEEWDGVVPEKLQFNQAQLRKLLAKKQLDAWPGEKYVEADVVADIAKILIGAFHPLLKKLKIAYLFTEKMQKNGKRIGGTASKADAKLRFLADYDFVIVINWTAWKFVTERQRLALLDHELLHCTTEDKDDGSKVPAMVEHDIEEFGAIVGRWGLWQLNLLNFSAQIDLFAKKDKAKK